jgi:hypothetical protein
MIKEYCRVSVCDIENSFSLKVAVIYINRTCFVLDLYVCAWRRPCQKPEHVARFGLRKVPPEYIFVTEGPAVCLSIHASRRNVSP